MAECNSAILYPDKDVPALPTVPFVQSEHVPNEPLDLGVHQLIDRRDGHRYMVEIGIVIKDFGKPSIMKGMGHLRMKLGLMIAFAQKMT